MELQNKHTIFGKCGGDTIYNVLKMSDAEIDSNERPTYPYKINKTEVLLNPFDDIVPRNTTKGDRTEEKSRKRKKEKGVKCVLTIFLCIRLMSYLKILCIFQEFWTVVVW